MTALDAAAALAPPKPSEQERKALHPRFNLGATTVADAFPRAGIVPDFIWDRLDVKELPTAAALGASNVLEVAAAAEGWPPFVLEQLRANLPERPTPPSASGGSGLPSCPHGCPRAAPRRPRRDRARRGARRERQRARRGRPLQMDPRRRVGPALRRLHREDVARCAGGGGGATAKARAITGADGHQTYYHILAPALLVTGGKLVVNQFEGPFPALGLSLKKVQFHLRQLGCAMAKSKADADKGATIATLKLPLAFPKESRGAPAARR